MVRQLGRRGARARARPHGEPHRPAARRPPEAAFAAARRRGEPGRRPPDLIAPQTPPAAPSVRPARAATVEQKRVLLIIGGGIAAYKSLDLIRRLQDRGARVRCILTAAAAHFITPLAAGGGAGAARPHRS